MPARAPLDRPTAAERTARRVRFRDAIARGQRGAPTVEHDREVEALLGLLNAARQSPGDLDGQGASDAA